MWLVPREDLTPTQVQAIELNARHNHVVTGGPGSGKTVVLAYRAATLIERGTPDSKLKIIVFTKTLRDYIKPEAQRFLDVPESCFGTFDQFCRDLYQRKVSRHLPWDEENKRPDFDGIRSGVLNFLRTAHDPPEFDAILVDEGQDLDAEALELLRLVSKHVTVMMDEKQQIYDTGSAIREALTALGLTSVSVNLTDTYRCCPYISALAGHFILDPAQRAFFVRQTRTEQTERETPLLYLAPDFDEEKRRLADLINERLQRNDRIAVLLPFNRQVHGFQAGLAEYGVDAEVPPKRANAAHTTAEYDWSSDRPKLMTYHSAKGLTFDTVFLPRLTPRSFANTAENILFRQLFIAIARATRWVYLSTDGGEDLPIFAAFRAAEREGILKIQNQVIAHNQRQPRGDFEF